MERIWSPNPSRNQRRPFEPIDELQDIQTRVEVNLGRQRIQEQEPTLSSPLGKNSASGLEVTFKP